MARHTLYCTPSQAKGSRVPVLILTVYQARKDTPKKVADAGYDYGGWLLAHASGTWVKALRRALNEYPRMEEEEDDG